jgi:YbbR domain-containing protein
LPEGVHLRVKGKFSQIRQLPTASRTFLNLGNITEPGEYMINLRLPEYLRDMQIVEQDLKQLRVELEARGSKELEIQIERRGEVDERFDIVREETSVENVVVSGPVSLVERITSAQIEPDVEGLDQNIDSRLFPLQIYDQDNEQVANELLRLKPAHVRYSLQLAPLDAFKVLKVYPDYAGELPEGYILVEISANPPTIAVPAELVKETDFAIRTSPINLSGARDNMQVKAELQYPFERPTEGLLPEFCTVTVEIMPITNLPDALSIPVDIVGRDETLDYLLPRQEIAVRLPDIDELSQSNITGIRAVINVSGLGPGEYRIVPQVSVPQQVEHVTIEPNIVVLNIFQQTEGNDD